VTDHLFPKEHGAYGQVTLPLATALILVGVNRVSLPFSISVLGAFLAHEPLQVLLGGRGVRTRREMGNTAAVWGSLWGLVSIVGGLAAFVAMAPSARWTIAWPLVPAAYVMVSAVRRRERTTMPEVGAAVAFSMAAVPICIDAGVGGGVASFVGVSYAVTFIVMTLAVRVVIMTTRAGGDAAAAAMARRALTIIAALSFLAAAGASVAGVWPRLAVLALCPGVLVAASMALRPPRATQLRSVGWALVGSAIATMVVVLLVLRG